MARLAVLGVLACLAVGALSLQERVWPHKVADKEFLDHQLNIFQLFYHVHEPNTFVEQATLGNTWDLEKKLEHFTNITAVKLLVDVWEYGTIPRGHIFSVLYPSHKFEAETLFHVLFSAKDWNTFLGTAAWARDHMNEGVFVHALSVAILHRPDTQGLILPPIYEIFPYYFFDTEILNTAQKLNVYGDRLIDNLPNVHKWNNDLVIDSNYTTWDQHLNEEYELTYFTQDVGLNNFYYYNSLDYPKWLGADVCPLKKDRRGERFLFIHQQLLARYYMERLSIGLGEIPVLSWWVPIETGYDSGLQYENGVQFPVRPNYLDLTRPEYLKHLEEVAEYENRIIEAIDLGWAITETGEHVSLRTPESIDVLGNIINSNVDSPNTRYYRDLITISKYLLGNAIKPLDLNHIVPSALEHHQTALRDPAFWQLWKRIYNLVIKFQNRLPHYKREQLVMPEIKINSVEVDKLMTYFENYHVNITNYLTMSKHEASIVQDEVSVLVRQPRLNHKVFNVRVNVNSDVSKTVLVKMFLAPKYDSTGKIIPLNENRVNFLELTHFTYDLKQGVNTIERSSIDFEQVIHDWTSAHVLYDWAEQALHGNGKFNLDMSEAHNGYPQRLVLPRGTRSGMPFTLLVYIHEYTAPKIPFGTGFDPIISAGLSSGARYLTDLPLGFPLERPIYEWTVEHIPNWYEKEVLIYHKHTPEVQVHGSSPHNHE